ncbi:MAG: nucleotidyl transferase AbiEii/AbiGii toxin family protein [Candidatus Yonathbacteria bacterium]|nr:nucleotidyl transferase AbiEii/AbiGii toxin family protein [Candidatus Yonathbacteria bacterium]
MMLHFETITTAMQDVARSIFENFDAGYYLAGGTALALHIGHRKSVDLDYFTAKPIDTLALKKNIGDVFPLVKVEIIFEEKNTLWCIIDSVKVSFISRPDALLEPVQTVDSVRLAGIKDITVMKLIAVCGREEYKDYFDLSCILDQTDPRSWIFWWQEIYPKQDITSWVVALSAVDLVQKIPLEINEDFKDKDVSKDIKRAVQKVTKQIQSLGERP